VALTILLAGCGGSTGTAQEAAAEIYLHERLQRLSPSHASDDIVVLCRRRSGSGLSCGTLVADPSSSDASIRQRWAINVDASGRIRGARLVSSRREAPPGPPPELRRLLAADAAQAESDDRRRSLARRRTDAVRRTLASARKDGLPIVRVRIAPRRRMFVCIEDGAGRRRFEGTTSRVVTAEGRRLRLNLGSRDAVVTVDGEQVPIPTSPYGLDLRPGVPRTLAPQERPCA
jgi:hypothetical protein